MKKNYSFKNTNSQFLNSQEQNKDFLWASSTDQNQLSNNLQSSQQTNEMNNEEPIQDNSQKNRFSESPLSGLQRNNRIGGKVAMESFQPKIVSSFDFDLLANGVKRGMKGLQGDTGRRGPTGPQGIKGDPGIKGIDAVLDPSIKGLKGQIGLVGDQGDRGEIGPKGDSGDPGDEGIPGEKGKRGRDGKDGIDGKMGPRGVKGPKGIKGEQGQAGKDGKAGPKGYKGDKGPKGPIGATGQEGPVGKRGPRGGNPALPPKRFIQNMTSTIIVEELTRLLETDRVVKEVVPTKKVGGFAEKSEEVQDPEIVDSDSKPNLKLDQSIQTVMERCNVGVADCPKGCAALVDGLVSNINQAQNAQDDGDSLELEKKFEDKLIEKAKACNVQWRR